MFHPGTLAFLQKNARRLAETTQEVLICGSRFNHIQGIQAMFSSSSYAQNRRCKLNFQL